MSAVSKADVLETYADLYCVFEDNKAICKELDKIYDRLNTLPPADPESHYDEWCDDCKEYDKERHCCPRWNKVIRETLKDAQPERKKGHWIPVDSLSAFGGDESSWISRGNPIAFYYCSECKKQAYAGEDGESLLTDFCPDCGADMRDKEGAQDDQRGIQTYA